MVEKNKEWSSFCSIESEPRFDRVTASIEICGPGHPLNEVAFLSYDNGDDDVRIHLHKVDNIPLPLLLEGIEDARKTLLEEK